MPDTGSEGWNIVRDAKGFFILNGDIHLIFIFLENPLATLNIVKVREMSRPDELENIKFRIVFRLINCGKTQSIWMSPSCLDPEGLSLCKAGHTY